MPIPVRCPGCQAEYQLVDHLGGQRVVCRHCQQAFEVPVPAAGETQFSAVPAACASATRLADSAQVQARQVQLTRAEALVGWLRTPVPLGYVLVPLLALACLGTGIA
jgi:hypothetical protein